MSEYLNFRREGMGWFPLPKWWLCRWW